MTTSTATGWTGKPCVSVVIPARNAVSTIGRTLESLAKENDAIHEIILVDDESSDGTSDVAVDVANRYSLPLAVVGSDKQNAGAARNVGLDRAVGRFVYLLDADDEVAENGLRALVERLEGAKDASLAVGGYVRRAEGRKDKSRLPFGFTKDRMSNAHDYLRNDIRSIAMGAALLRREAIKGTRFPEKMRYDEDTLFWAAVLTQVEVTVIQRVVLIYNTDNKRYIDRFTKTPQGDFVRTVAELRNLRRFGIEDRVLKWREGWLARRTARALIQTGATAAARKFLKVSMTHAELRYAPTTLRYALRILLSRAPRVHSSDVRSPAQVTRRSGLTF